MPLYDCHSGLGDERQRKIEELQKQQLEIQKKIVQEEVPFVFSKLWLSVAVIGIVALIAMKK